MFKSISVYPHSSNPVVDPPKFRITRFEADERVNKHYAFWIAPNAIQNMPPPAHLVDRREQLISGLYDQAWMPRWSGDYIVWQMRPEAA